jgi:hypothetical protein
MALVEPIEVTLAVTAVHGYAIGLHIYEYAAILRPWSLAG